MAKKRRTKRDAQWAEAKRRCRLSDEDVRMAKELGMAPRSLTKNIPSRYEPWKAPVKDWIRDLYRRHFTTSHRPEPTIPTSGTSAGDRSFDEPP